MERFACEWPKLFVLKNISAYEAFKETVGLSQYSLKTITVL